MGAELKNHQGIASAPSRMQRGIRSGQLSFLLLWPGVILTGVILGIIGLPLLLVALGVAIQGCILSSGKSVWAWITIGFFPAILVIRSIFGFVEHSH